jgi:hypothetical protein
VIEFFSADEECLQKEYLLQTNECQSAYKTLDLYLHSPSRLVDEFVRTQHMQQNHVDFAKSYGKLRFQVEMRQNPKLKTEFFFSVKVLEARALVPAYDYNLDANINSHAYYHNYTNGFSTDTNSSNSNATVPVSSTSQNAHMPFVEIYMFGPCSERKWKRKLIKHSAIDPVTKIALFKDAVFDFKVTVSPADLNIMHGNSNEFLSNYELQLVVSDSNSPKQFRITGVAVLNLSEVARSARVWRKLKLEDELASGVSFGTGRGGVDEAYGCMELWIALRARLKINEQGDKILRVLERHSDDSRACEFIQLKNLCRHYRQILWN